MWNNNIYGCGLGIPVIKDIKYSSMSQLCHAYPQGVNSVIIGIQSHKWVMLNYMLKVGMKLIAWYL